MKNTLTTICLLIYLSSFSQTKKVFIEQFKMVYFCDCLKYGFENSKEILNILEIDKSMSREPFLGDSYILIKQLAMVAAKKIEEDSDLHGTEKAEGSEGKSIFYECLKNYNSKWLEKLAKKEYKRNNKPF